MPTELICWFNHWVLVLFHSGRLHSVAIHSSQNCEINFHFPHCGAQESAADGGSGDWWQQWNSCWLTLSIFTRTLKTRPIFTRLHLPLFANKRLRLSCHDATRICAGERSKRRDWCQHLPAAAQLTAGPRACALESRHKAPSAIASLTFCSGLGIRWYWCDANYIQEYKKETNCCRCSRLWRSCNSAL